MIKKIVVKQLFGKFDYSIEFGTENIIIITGPNGYGKTTLLKMIDHFCNENIEELINFNFKKFCIIGDKNKIEFKKEKEGFFVDNIFIKYPEEKRFFDEDVVSRRVRYYYDNEIEYYKSFFDEETNELIDSNDKYFYKIMLDYKFKKDDQQKTKKEVESIKKEIETIKKAFNKIEDARQQIGRVSFIKEQRLIEKKELKDEERRRGNKFTYITVINEQSEKLKSELSDIMRRHSELSSELDSTYIKRLFDKKEEQTDVKSIKEELEALQSKQNKLKTYRLAEIDNVSYINNLDDDKINKFNTELSIFIEDANNKYNIFAPIIEKLDLYKEIVNQKLSFKKMTLSRENGIEVKSEKEEQLPLDKLSSGEQEIIVLFYKLIFESQANLILIDEPEISLHIAWQKGILDNFKSIVQLNKNVQVIIATHSPQILSGNVILQRDLGGQYNV